MFFGLMRRAARGLRAGSAPREGVLPAVPPDHGAALEALGAQRLRATLFRETKGGPLHLVYSGPAPPTGGLLAIAVAARVSGSVAQLWAQGPDRVVHDRLALEPSARPITAWLIVPNNGSIEVHIQPATPSRGTSTVAGGVWVLPETAVAPERLVARAPLVADAAWSRAYGTVPPGDAPARLRERVFAGMTHPALVETLDGLRLWLAPGDELSRAVFLTGLYEPAMLVALRSLLPEGGVFVDVGAHCGLVSAFAARLVGPEGRVIAFEPSPREFARLDANVAAGGLAQVETRQMAVADAPGVLTLRLAEAGHAGHNTVGERFAYDGVKVEALVEVAATTLDEALAGLDRCDLIKMDIEGAELRALRGGAATLARLRPALIVEVFDRSLAGCGDTEEAVLAWLDDAGYDAREVDLATGTFASPARVSPGESRNIVALPRR